MSFFKLVGLILFFLVSCNFFVLSRLIYPIIYLWFQLFTGCGQFQITSIISNSLKSTFHITRSQICYWSFISQLVFWYHHLFTTLATSSDPFPFHRPCIDTWFKTDICYDLNQPGCMIQVQRSCEGSMGRFITHISLSLLLTSPLKLNYHIKQRSTVLFQGIMFLLMYFQHAIANILYD